MACLVSYFAARHDRTQNPLTISQNAPSSRTTGLPPWIARTMATTASSAVNTAAIRNAAGENSIGVLPDLAMQAV